jgi:hypothetical protein
MADGSTSPKLALEDATAPKMRGTAGMNSGSGVRFGSSFGPLGVSGLAAECSLGCAIDDGSMGEN